MPLTDVQIRQAKPADKPIKLLDSDRLYLLGMPSGSKLWRYRYRIDGRENLYAIGEYPTISLQEARTRRDQARGLVKQGIHPSHERQRTRSDQTVHNVNTFKAIAEQWIDAHRGRWSAYYLKQVESYFRRDVYPKIGKRPIRAVTAADVLDILTTIAGRGAEAAAINVRQWISGVFRHAVATLRADTDPAAALRGAVIRPPVQNASPKDRDEIRDFLARLRMFGGNRTTAIALRLLLIL
ncbi:MAG: tyrosine-type recombinase/integrase, partial [Lysobacter sp.]